MRAVVVGAGLSGLAAAGRLASQGHHVVVVDKGRGPGGRMATRRITTPDGRTARLDHGAQFFTVRSPELALLVRAWIGQGVVREWSTGFARGSADRGQPGESATVGDGYPRYVAVDGMASLAKHLSRDLDVRCNSLAFAVRPGSRVGTAGWDVALDDGTALEADAVVLTCPVPQSFALAVTSGVDLPEDLVRTEYDRTLALLAVLDRPGLVPSPGGVQEADGVFSWIGDNVAKGISEVPALTFHANPLWSEAHWDDPPDDIAAALRLAATPWLGEASILASEIKRWRFATPRTLWPHPCWIGGDDSPLVLAGDAFAGPRVEGAILSGLAAADALLVR